MSWPNPSYTRWSCGPTNGTVEDGLVLTVHKLARHVAMAGPSGFWRSWQWSINGEVCSTIGYVLDFDGDATACLKLAFRINGDPVEQNIDLCRSQCRFGGYRWYAICPQTGRRVSKLYLPSGGRLFLARCAYRLGYRSQRECRAGRAALRRHRIAARYGIDPELPFKPKWKRYGKFNRTLAALNALDAVWGAEMKLRFGFEL